MQNRIYKFRVWDTWNKKMHLISSIEWGYDSDPKKAIVRPTGNPQDNFALLSRNLELMQYTGLKDKNGVGIYEGDVVYVLSYRNVKVCHVVYSRASFVLKENNPNNDIRISLQDEYEMEIIGNIWENPDLLTH